MLPLISGGDELADEVLKGVTRGNYSCRATIGSTHIALAPDNDNVIDCSNWLYVSLRRANKPNDAAAVLKRITPDMKNKEPHLAFYLRLPRFIC